MIHPFVRIAPLDLSVLNFDCAQPMFKTFFEKFEESFELASELICTLSDNHNTHLFLDEIQIISDSFEDLTEEPAFAVNPAEVALNLIKSHPSDSGNTILSKLNDTVSMFHVAGLDSDETEALQDNFISNASQGVYPLYCKPSDAVLRKLVELDMRIGFVECQDSFFLHITACGQDMSAHIAYGFLLVDDYIPNNIADEKTDLSNLPLKVQTEMNAYFSSLKDEVA